MHATEYHIYNLTSTYLLFNVFLESSLVKREIAKRMYLTPCKKGCFLTYTLDDCTGVLVGCIEEVENLTRAEKKQYLFDKLLLSGGRQTSCSYKPNYNLGVGTNMKMYGVCHQCFQTAYDIGHSMLDDIRKGIREGCVRVPDSSQEKPINDRSGGKFDILFSLSPRIADLIIF